MLVRYPKNNKKNKGIRVNHTCSGADCLKAMYSAGITCRSGLTRITGI